MAAEKNHPSSDTDTAIPVFLRPVCHPGRESFTIGADRNNANMPGSQMTPSAFEMEIGEGADARRIAICHRTATKGGRPGLVWLGGYRSDMAGTKAVELDRFAGETGLACTRFDYSGHGVSGGDFRQGTISRWLEESLAVFDRFAAGPQILVGSSMGGWIALRMVQELQKRGQRDRVHALLLLAPAPDFTSELHEPLLTREQKRDLETQGFFEEETPYGPDPNVFTRALFEDGRKNRVLTGLIETGCPVHILQGMADPDVPYTHALKLVEHLPAEDVVLTLVRDGDHRLSRPQDIDLLLDTVARMAG
jgi:pimeloyl-ACP methyl ester carboxylesterase